MALPATWKNWVLQELLKRRPAVQILQKLMENGFRFEDGKAALGNNLPANVNSPFNNEFYAELAKPKFLQDQNIQFDDYSSDEIQLYGISNFLSEEECQQIIEAGHNHFEPSKISAKVEYSHHRTSSTCNLSFLDAPVIGIVDERIKTTMGLPVGDNEVMQAQWYKVGQEFKSHTDYFNPGSEEFRKHGTKRGQRTWTFMIYLNEGCKGGETEFKKIEKVFTPKVGYAVIWNSLFSDGSPNPNTEHHARPVKEGEKYVITKWFRTVNQ